MEEAFDYIVIGAGSAGGVLAARLSEDPSARVLVLEAGGDNRTPLVAIPAGVGRISVRPCAQNWAFTTEPEPHLNNRQLPVPRGRGLGGTSAINGMVYIRGHAGDYDQWRQMGLKGWGYEDVLPYFRGLERHIDGETPFHGAGGPLKVSNADSTNPLFDAVVEAGRQAGHKVTEDFNGAQQEGFGRYDCNIARGRRNDTGYAFLRPAARRANLAIRTGAFTTKVLIEDGRAVAVEYARGKGGPRQVVRAAREVILCAGVIQSPQILQLSGVGDPERLKAAGVDVAHALKGVGGNLQDHLDIPVGYACPLPLTMASRAKGLKGLGMLLSYALLRNGPLAEGVCQTGAFLKSRPELERPNLQCSLVTAAIKDGRLVDGYMFRICQLDPESRGRVDAKSPDPFEPPSILFNYLATDYDRATLREAVRIVRRFMVQPAMDPYRGIELAPGDAVQADDEIDAFVRETAMTDYHPAGSCRMGVAGDAMAVVDEELRVFGIAGLRVADASVMPVVVGGNTNAPSMMIGEKCADMIRRAVR